MTQAIAQMEKVTQSWAATAEECAAASEELSAQAQMALSSVGRLETQVVGHPRVLAGAAAPAAGPAHRGTAVTVVREPKPAAPLAARLLPLDEAEETGTFARF